MIYILIPIFNRKALTLACLASFAQQTYKNYEIIVVDDGSTDGSSEAIEAAYPQIKIIYGNGNWWWTKSMNEGLRVILASAKPEDFVLTINNDVEVAPSYLQTLHDVSTAHNRALVGSVVKNYYDHTWIQDGGVNANWYKFYFPKLEKIDGSAINQNIDVLSGRGMLIPAEVFAVIGFFSNMLPHYSADYDFSIRAKRHGFKLIVSNDAVVYSKDRPGDKEWPFWQRYFSRRSSSNIPMQISLALRGAPTMYLKIKCVGIVFARFGRAFIYYLAKKLRIF